jgi:tRNA G18 (ribose-2'-O)-methylase SpoU
VYVPPLGLPLDEVRHELDRIRHPFRIAIERAKNPFNIGAIIRVAHSFLVQEIILIGDAPYYERAAMGMHRYENIVGIPTEEAFVAHAKQRGWPLIAFEKDHAQASLWATALPDHCCMLFGNENDGLSPTLLHAADAVVAIPMFGINHSYPVTAAASIAMAEWARRYYTSGASSTARPTPR